MSKRQETGSAVLRTPRPETRPSPQQCPTCQAHVLRAWTTSGLEVVVDAPALTTLGELDATMAGRATYTWHRVPDHLVRRYPLVIRSRPAGTPRQTVHPAHVCGTTWPPGSIDPPPVRGRTPASDLPPY